MTENKIAFLRPFISVAFFICFVITFPTGFVLADDKIGLDLEWRPIKGVETRKLPWDRGTLVKY